MTPNYLTHIQRDKIVQEIRDLARQHDAMMDQGHYAAARPVAQRMNALTEDYLDRLPLVNVSVCPFDDLPLIWSFDPFGLDGEWWRPEAQRRRPNPCRHFCTLRGAVNLNGKTPKGPDFDAVLGPEVPYVIPRLMDFPGMKAVVAELPMVGGQTAYTIAYFADRRPPVQQLAADWPAKHHAYKTAAGQQGFNYDNDPWTFDLEPYLKSGQLLWCPPGKDNTVVQSGPPDQFPFADVKGERQRMVINAKGAFGTGTPKGDPVTPIDND